MIGRNVVLQPGSTKRIWVPVIAPPGVDVSGLVVEMAFREPTFPDAVVEWFTASWVVVGGAQCASLVVGPAGVPLARGDYEVFWRIPDADPEVPVEVAPNRLIVR